MCGIFGIISTSPIDENDLRALAKHAQQRGRDSSGLMSYLDGIYQIHRADYPVMTLLKKKSLNNTSIVLGHSRLITNGLADNQPVVRDGVIVFHNGIVVNDQSLWENLKTVCDTLQLKEQNDFLKIDDLNEYWEPFLERLFKLGVFFKHSGKLKEIKVESM